MSEEKKENGGAAEVPMLKLTHDIDGKAFLPDQQPTAVRELWETGIDYEKTKSDRIALGKKEGELKKELERLYGKYPQFFAPSDNDPNLLIYAVGGLVIDANRKETVEIKTHKDAPPPPISNANLEEKTGKKGKGKSPADIY